MALAKFCFQQKLTDNENLIPTDNVSNNISENMSSKKRRIGQKKNLKEQSPLVERYKIRKKLMENIFVFFLDLGYFEINILIKLFVILFF